MNFLKKILLVVFLLIPCYTIDEIVAGDYIQQVKLPLYNGRPTTTGINYYVKTNENKFIREFEEMVEDTLYDVYITVDNIKNHTDSNEVLAFCVTGQGFSEIIVTNEPRYLQYEYSMMSPYQRQVILEANNFVKGAIFHELTHNYFNQVIKEMRMDSMFVSPEYNNFSMMSRNSFESSFIEEGIAVYVTVKKGENIFGQDFILENINQLLNKEYKYYVMYNYSCVFVRPILDKYGIKKGMMLIIGNNPPTIEEIINPSKYYNRLK